MTPEKRSLVRDIGAAFALLLVGGLFGHFARIETHQIECEKRVEAEKSATETERHLKNMAWQMVDDYRDQVEACIDERVRASEDPPSSLNQGLVFEMDSTQCFDGIQPRRISGRLTGSSSITMSCSPTEPWRPASITANARHVQWDLEPRKTEAR